MKIPVILLNWNGTDDTIQSVESVRKQTFRNHQIYLADNYSVKDERDTLAEHFSNAEDICFIQNTSNLGFARAHNRIFEIILQDETVPYIVLLNNDAFAETNWLEKMVNCAEKHQAGMVSCKMLFHENPDRINNLGHKFLNTGEILPIAWNEPAASNREVKFNAGASGGACLYSVKMLREIGLFDEYFVTGYEDAELGVRAMVAGYPLVYEPSAIVYHKVGASINKVRDYKYTLKLQLDILYAYFKLMPIMVILWNMPAVIFRTAILFALFGLWGRWTYFRIFFHGWFLIVTRDRKTLMESRKRFAPHRKLKWYQIIRKQDFFLADNYTRFKTYFLQGEKTIFEKYK